MIQVTTVLDLPRPVTEVFDYLARPLHVVTLSLPALHLQIVEGPGRLHLGATVVWKGRRWGFSRRLVTEVIAFEENKRLIEEQRDGPFAHWRHSQHFEESTAGMRLIAQIDFEPPTGMLGRLVTSAVIVKDLQAAWAHRDQKLKELFS